MFRESVNFKLISIYKIIIIFVICITNIYFSDLFWHSAFFLTYNTHYSNNYYQLDYEFNDFVH